MSQNLKEHLTNIINENPIKIQNNKTNKFLFDFINFRILDFLDGISKTQYQNEFKSWTNDLSIYVLTTSAE
jgi:hypothetical protein